MRYLLDTNIVSAAVLCHNLMLVTNDRHFSYMREVQIENWLADCGI